MSNIEQNLAFILSSRYGEDVRQAIHDAIHDCYEDGKAGATDLVAREQIANLVANAGDGTKDSEVVDARVGYDGTEYKSLGEAVREQVGALYWNIEKSFINVFNIFYGIKNIKKGEYYKVLLDVNGTSSEFSIAFRFKDNDTNYQKRTFVITNTLNTEFILHAEDHYYGLFFYTAQRLESVNIRVQNITEVIQNDSIEELSKLVLNLKLVDENIELLMNQDRKIPYKINKGDVFVIDFSNCEFDGSFKIGIAFRKNNEVGTNYQLIYNTIGNTSISYTSEDEYDSIVLYAFISCSFTLNIVKISKLSLMDDYIKELSESGQLNKKYKTFSILSDSYSTFEGFTVPETNIQWYPPIEGNQGANTGNNVMDIEDTWWYLFSNEYQCSLIQNNSYSGSPICNDGYGAGNDDAKSYSFVKRVQNIGKSELIIVFGGTNDSWDGAEMGEYIYSDWTDENLNYFRPALSYVLNYLKQHHMGSKIIFILNNGLSDEVNESVTTICEHYSVDLLKLSNEVTKIGNHPDKNGMVTIKNELINFLKEH